MKKILFVFTFLLSSFFSLLVWSSENYGDCVLENLKGTNSDVAARAVINICKLKYKPICVATDAQVTNNIIFLTNVIEPFSGKNHCQYPNGITKSIGNVQNGKKNGKWIWWYQNGNIGLEKNYKEGKKDGKLINWFKDTLLEGQIKLEENYKEGKKDGKSTFWYENGQIRSEENYKEGKKDGNFVLWSITGDNFKKKIYKDNICISGDC